MDDSEQIERLLARAREMGGRNIPTRIAADLEREVFLSGYYKAFGYGSGPCSLCTDCNLESCVHPRRARPAMEACGIDVYATVRASGLHIEVVRNHSQSQDYYGLVLVD